MDFKTTLLRTEAILRYMLSKKNSGTTCIILLTTGKLIKITCQTELQVTHINSALIEANKNTNVHMNFEFKIAVTDNQHISF